MTQTPLVTGTCNDEQSPAPLVEVAFARTRREARELCKLLQAEGIACAVEGPGTVPGRGLAVLADAGALVRASDLLSIRSLGEEDDDLDIDSDTDDLDDDVDDDLDDDDDDDDDYDDDDDEFDDDEDEDDEEEEDFEADIDL